MSPPHFHLTNEDHPLPATINPPPRSQGDVWKKFAYPWSLARWIYEPRNRVADRTLHSWLDSTRAWAILGLWIYFGVAHGGPGEIGWQIDQFIDDMVASATIAVVVVFVGCLAVLILRALGRIASVGKMLAPVGTIVFSVALILSAYWIGLFGTGPEDDEISIVDFLLNIPRIWLLLFLAPAAYYASRYMFRSSEVDIRLEIIASLVTVWLLASIDLLGLAFGIKNPLDVDNFNSAVPRPISALIVVSGLGVATGLSVWEYRETSAV